MSTLDKQDITLLVLGLDLLSRYADTELVEAHRRENNARQLAMLSLHYRIAAVRVKLSTMQVPS